MAFLRRLSSAALLGGAIAIQLFGELSSHVTINAQPWHSLWAFLFVGGPVFRPAACAYPVIPWLSIMMAGWVLGRWLLQRPTDRVRPLVAVGVALLGVFALVRGLDGYGNWGLYRDSLAPLQWLHVAKYPPSLSYSALELGIAFLLLAAFVAVDDEQPRRWLEPLGLLGATAFFYYLLHVHLLKTVSPLFNPDTHGLVKTYVAAAAALVLLYPLCVLYRRYKSAHPDGWTRYI
jgi:uncharacterized membrane protein